MPNSVESLSDRRIRLGVTPSPLHRLYRLEAALRGPKLWMKRDDLNGFAFGGNKVRKLELLLRDALDQNATCLVTVGAVQSNHARVTAVAGKLAGLKVHLVLAGLRPKTLSGNLLLVSGSGATLHFEETSAWSELESRMHMVAADLRNNGEHPYLIPMGGSTPVGAAAFVDAAAELIDQLPSPPTRIVVASSTGGTQAGLEVGLRQLRARTHVSGIGVAKDQGDITEKVANLANRTAELLGVAQHWSRHDIDVWPDHVGSGYGNPSEASIAAAALVLQTEGIYLDGAYTSKAMAGLIAEVASGRIAGSEEVVFWHTGGLPQLFA